MHDTKGLDPLPKIIYPYAFHLYACISTAVKSTKKSEEVTLSFN